MGSFNTTCFASQQTISMDDNVYLYPIMQQLSFNPVKLIHYGKNGLLKMDEKYSFCNHKSYPHDLWKSAGPILKGKYNDFGSFKLDNTNENIIAMQSLFNYLYFNSWISEAGENKIHEISFDIRSKYNPKVILVFDELNIVWNYVWESMQKNRIFLKTDKDSSSPFTFAVMHETTGKYLINKVNQFNNDDESLEQFSYFKSYLNKKLNNSAKFFKMDNEFIKDYLRDLSDLDNLNILSSGENCFKQFYKHNNEKMANLLIDYYKKNNNLEIDDLTLKNIFNILKSHLDYKYIVSGLNLLNIKFSPMINTRQDYNNDIGNEVKEMINSVNKEINKNFNRSLKIK